MKPLLHKLVYFLLIIMFSQSSCRLEAPLSPDLCSDFPPSSNGEGYIWGREAPFVDMTVFNPNNSEEILFRLLSQNLEEYSHQLVKYNIETKEHSIIYEGDILGLPRWGIDDWILLSLSDRNVYKIKSDGTELTQLTFTQNCLYPEWSHDGEKIIYTLGFTSPTQFVISDNNGQSIDTTTVGVGARGSWKHKTLIANPTSDGLYIGNPYTQEYDLFHELNVGGSSGRGAVWYNEEIVLWSNQNGIYKSNLFTEELELLRPSCDSRRYSQITVAQDGTVLYRKTEFDLIQPQWNRGIAKSVLYITDVDFQTESKLTLDL